MNRELSDYIRQARRVGQSEEKIKQDLLAIAWKEEDIDRALAESHEAHSDDEAPWKVKLEMYVQEARKAGKSDEEIKNELSKLAWREEDINETLTVAPKSLFRYAEEVSRAAFWKTSFQNLRRRISENRKNLIATALILAVGFVGISYLFAYMNAIKIRKEKIAQSLQNLPIEQRDCVLDKVDLAFLEQIQEAQAFPSEYYKEQMELLGNCVLHKAQPL